MVSSTQMRDAERSTIEPLIQRLLVQAVYHRSFARGAAEATACGRGGP